MRSTGRKLRSVSRKVAILAMLILHRSQAFVRVRMQTAVMPPALPGFSTRSTKAKGVSDWSSVTTIMSAGGRADRRRTGRTGEAACKGVMDRSFSDSGRSNSRGERDFRAPGRLADRRGGRRSGDNWDAEGRPSLRRPRPGVQHNTHYDSPRGAWRREGRGNRPDQYSGSDGANSNSWQVEGGESPSARRPARHDDRGHGGGADEDLERWLARGEPRDRAYERRLLDKNLTGIDDVTEEDLGIGQEEVGIRAEEEAGADAPASGWMKSELAGVQNKCEPEVDQGASEHVGLDMLYGIAPVLNALRNNRRRKIGLYCQDGVTTVHKKDRVAAAAIYDLARDSDIPMTIADKGYLNTLCGNRPHQGFVLRAHPLDFEPISFLPGAITETEGVAEMQAGDSPPELPPTVPGQVWLALDEVTDPQNFGALLRSAHFFGVGGVVTCAKNSSGLTATVSKASAGALEVMRVHSAANMMRFLRRSRENGWRIVGTSVSERSMALQDLNSGPSAPPTVVVLGNEGRGVRTNVLRECDVVVEVAGGGQGATLDTAAASTVDSLNVSVTGGVMLYHLLAGAKRASVSAADVGSEPPAAAAPAM